MLSEYIKTFFIALQFILIMQSSKSARSYYMYKFIEKYL